jgi:hypothetical protein
MFFIAIVLQLVHRPQGKLLPTTRQMYSSCYGCFFLVIALSLPMKEDSPVGTINNTRRAVILDSKLAQDIRGSLLCQFLHLNRLLHYID